VGPLSVTKERIGEVVPPFRGWLVSGERWESFDVEGIYIGTEMLDVS
jgi:hypothetical protein